MSTDNIHPNAVATPDKRFADAGEADSNGVVAVGESRVKKIDDLDIPLEMARAQLGRAFRRTVRASDLKSSAFGDVGQVSRLGSGDWPEPVVKAWQRSESRRELLRQLARESGLFDERFSLEEKKTGT